MNRLAKGAVIAARELVAISGERVQLPGASLVHLQFRRFAGCPVCNLHLRSFARRHGELAAAGIREVALFHAPDEVLRPFVNDLPFAVVADPQKTPGRLSRGARRHGAGAQVRRARGRSLVGGRGARAGRYSATCAAGTTCTDAGPASSPSSVSFSCAMI